MRGCFRVTFIVQYMLHPHEFGEWSYVPALMMTTGYAENCEADQYIPASRIECVKKYNSLEELVLGGASVGGDAEDTKLHQKLGSWEPRFMASLIWWKQRMYPKENWKCTCGYLDKDGWPSENGSEICTCDWSGTWPIYAIEVKNTQQYKYEYCIKNGPDMPDGICTPPTIHYLLHPEEAEHMERFLAGTDDPIYDLVHELRYNPRITLDSDVQDAKQKFEQRKRARLHSPNDDVE